MISHEFNISAEVTVKDSNGKVKRTIDVGNPAKHSTVKINDKSYPFRSFLNNFIKFLYVHMSDYVGPDVKSFTGLDEVTETPLRDAEKWVRFDTLRNDTYSDVTRGVAIGTGTTSVNSGEYKLEAIVPAVNMDKSLDVNGGLVQVLDVVEANNVVSFTNNTGVDINIRETGINLPVWENSAIPANTGDTMLIARDSFPTDNVVGDGGVAEVTYKLEFDSSPSIGFTDNFILSIISGMYAGSSLPMVPYTDIDDVSITTQHPFKYPGGGEIYDIINSSNLTTNLRGLTLSIDNTTPLNHTVTKFTAFTADNRAVIGPQSIDMVGNSVVIRRSITSTSTPANGISKIGFISNGGFLLFYIEVPSIPFLIGDIVDVKLTLDIGY